MAEAQVEQAPTPTPPPDNPVLTAEEAADWLSSLDDNQGQQPEEAPPPKAKEPPAKEPEQEAQEESEQPPVEEPEEAADETEAEDTAPPDEEAASGEDETDEGDPEDDDLPAIEPPRSLSKADREVFNSLPREAQQRWAEIEDSRARDFTRRQRETDEKQRALEAERKQAEQARQQYEAALPTMMEHLQSEFAEKFPDIRTEADIARLAQQDPTRYIQYDALQKKWQRYNDGLSAARERQRKESFDHFSRYVQEEDAKFTEANPQWSDTSEEAPKLRKMAIELLEGVGFSREEIVSMWQEGQPLSARDHRFQGLIAELVDLKRRVKNAEANLTRAKAKPKPPVNRPGAARQKVDVASEERKRALEKLDQTGSIQDAVAFLGMGSG